MGGWGGVPGGVGQGQGTVKVSKLVGRNKQLREG